VLKMRPSTPSRLVALLLAPIALVAIALVASASAQTTNPPIDVPRQLVDEIEQRNWDRAAERIESGDDVRSSQPDGMTPLHWAVFHGHADTVRRLLDAKADVNAGTEYAVTPLSIACQNGDAAITSLLVEAGADVNAALPGDITPLMVAARTGNADVVRTLVEHGADVDATERKGQTALMWAAAEGNAAAVDQLLLSGADLDQELRSGFTAWMFAARQGHIDVVDRLLQAGADIQAVMKPANTNGRAPRARMSALMLAVESGHFELAMFLVHKGADPNDQRSGFAPLHAITWVRKAARGDGIDGDPPPRGSGNLHSLQFVREIVAAGADVNLQLDKGSAGRAKLNRRGATPFLFASKTADFPLLKLLLELGADPTITNVDGCTPLMAAAGIGVTAVGEEPGTVSEVLEAIRLMISLGADPNAVDNNGETAIHGATYRLYPEAIALLTEFGADPKVWNHKNKYGWTPQLIAAGHRPGSLKPSPETMAALEAAIKASAK
jgi:ankyrin repeat protein